MKKLIFSITAVIMPFMAMAYGSWTLQDKAYRVDTLFHAKIGPGTTQTSLVLSGGSNLRVFYTTTDLSDPNVDIRVVKANDKLTGCATLSTMASSNTKEGAKYFSGVNADFFSNMQPIGSTVVDGEVYYAANSGWVNWYMNDMKIPGIETLSFKGTATSGSSSHQVSGVNVARGENNLVIYTSRIGGNTGTNIYGAEVSIVPEEGDLSFVGKSTYRVTSDPSETGSMPIPAGGYVLSGNGTGSDFIKTLSSGMTLTIDLDTETETGGKIMQMAGGLPIILSGGNVLETQGALDHLTALNPRTAVGFSSDKKKLVLLVVDGRSIISAGVVSKVLADIMLNVGCSEAMNFDGGGSSELYTSDFGVRNKPSDGKERAVTNAVFAVATSPADDEVAEISFVNPSMTLPRYGYFEPTFFGYNRYGVLISTDLKGVTLSCPDELGEIVEDGRILFANGSGCHALTARYGDVSTTIPVTIGTSQPQMRLENVVVDSYRDYKAEVTAVVNEETMPIDNSALTWESSSPEIAQVDESGMIHGVSDGTATITGTVDDFSGSIGVSVEIPRTRHSDIDTDPDPATWTTGKTGLKTLTLSRSGDNGIAVDYTVNSTRGTAFTIKKNLTLKSLPDSIRVVINPGDASITSITINAGAHGDRAIAATYTPTLTPNANNVILAPVSDFADVTDFKSYPIEFTSVICRIGDGVNTSRHVEFPAIQAVYTAVSEETGGVGDTCFINDEGVAVIYPNPVNAGLTVNINSADELDWSVYSISGKQVKKGYGKTFDTVGMEPGVYLVCLTSSTTVTTARLIVK